MVMAWAGKRENAIAGRISGESPIIYRDPTEATEGRGARTDGQRDRDSQPAQPYSDQRITSQRTDPHPTRLHPHLRLRAARRWGKYPISKIISQNVNQRKRYQPISSNVLLCSWYDIGGSTEKLLA